MANHPQALKRHRQSLTRRARNRNYKTIIKGQVKKLRTAINEEVDPAELETLYRTAASTIHRVAQKGIISSNTANRTVGRLAKAITAGPVEAHKKKSKKKLKR